MSGFSALTRLYLELHEVRLYCSMDKIRVALRYLANEFECGEPDGDLTVPSPPGVDWLRWAYYGDEEGDPPILTDTAPQVPIRELITEAMEDLRPLTDQESVVLRKRIQEARATDAELATVWDSPTGYAKVGGAINGVTGRLLELGFSRREVDAADLMWREAQPPPASPVPGTTLPKTEWKPDIDRLYDRLNEAKQTGSADCLFAASGLLAMVHEDEFKKFIEEVKTARKAGLKVDVAGLMKLRREQKRANASACTRQNIAAAACTGEPPAIITCATWEIAGNITANSHFAVDAGRRLFFYKDGLYQPHGDHHIKRQVKEILTAAKKPDHWYKKKVEEVVEYIAVDAPRLWERPPLDVINVANGLVSVSGRTLTPHSPDHLSPIQVPVKFDPTARCPVIDKFVLSTFPSDAVVIAYEIPAWLVTPDTSIQKAILLLGDGANGKSTYLCLVIAFIGRRNCSAVSLHKLEADRFSIARLVGRLANICPDLPGTDLTSSSIFKAITGGDELQGERKFADAFEFTPFARLLFSANHPPRSSDASSAFFRRWLVLPFEQRFVEGHGKAIPRRELDAMLSEPTELSGLLNKALDALPGLRERGFSESVSTKAAMDEFRQTTDPLAVWLDRNTVGRPDAFVRQDTLCAMYNDDCTRRGRPTTTKQAFGRALIQLRPKLEKRQKTVNGVSTWCYFGIGLLTPEPM